MGKSLSKTVRQAADEWVQAFTERDVNGIEKGFALGWNPNVPNRQGVRPLMATEWPYLWSWAPRLVAAGARVNVVEKRSNRTLLAMAVEYDSKPSAKVAQLLAWGDDPNLHGASSAQTIRLPPLKNLLSKMYRSTIEKQQDEYEDLKRCWDLLCQAGAKIDEGILSSALLFEASDALIHEIFDAGVIKRTKDWTSSPLFLLTEENKERLETLWVNWERTQLREVTKSLSWENRRSAGPKSRL